MKNQWSQFPFVLRRKILLTFLAGVASIAVSLVIFTVAADRILWCWVDSFCRFSGAWYKLWNTVAEPIRSGGRDLRQCQHPYAASLPQDPAD